MKLSIRIEKNIPEYTLKKLFEQYIDVIAIPTFKLIKQLLIKISAFRVIIINIIVGMHGIIEYNKYLSQTLQRIFEQVSLLEQLHSEVNDFIFDELETKQMIENSSISSFKNSNTNQKVVSESEYIFNFSNTCIATKDIDIS